MDQSFNLELIIAQWKRDYGKLTRSTKWSSEYYQIPIKDRYELLKILIKQIKDAGKTEDFFYAETNKERIIKSCIPHEKGLANPQSYGLFQKGAREHLTMAIVDVFSKEKPKTLSTEESIVEFDVYKVKEFDPSTSNVPESNDVIDPEMAELLGYNDK